VGPHPFGSEFGITHAQRLEDVAMLV
jgi:hypothetical protein